MGKLTRTLKAKLQRLSMFQAIEDENNTILFIRAMKEAAFEFYSHEKIQYSEHIKKSN